MFRVTQDDIQRIGNVETLMHFLEEKLNLPIQEGTTLAQIALPLPLPFLGLDESIAEQIIDCQDFSGLPKDALGERRPFLIRLRHQSGYAELLRAIAESLHQKSTNPADIFFICANEHFQPFAFAYFNDTGSEDWQTAVLNIRTWTQENTHIHTNSEHELPPGFFANEPSVGLDDFRKDETEVEKEEDFDEENLPPDKPKENIEISPSGDQSGVSPAARVKQTSSEDLFIKLQNIGAPLSQYVNIHSGILTGYNEAFVIDGSKRQQLIDENTASSELIKPLLVLGQKWKAGLTYLIQIPSSQNRHWSWSDTRNEWEAKRIFEKDYPAISAHLNVYENQLKRRSHQGRFYWEFAASNLYSIPKRPKIVYPRSGAFMRAAYDTSEALPLFPGHFIPTEDLSLLAILNSTLFNWYVQTYRAAKSRNNTDFKKVFMKDVPISARTQAQKDGFSKLVQQILAAPDSLAVPDFEKKIDLLVYELYGLTDAEIALVTEHVQLSSIPQDKTTLTVTPTSAQHTAPVSSQTQTEADRLLSILQNTKPQLAVSPPNPTVDKKTENRSAATVSSDALLAKLQNMGAPLGQNWSIHTGITPGRVQAFVIDKFTGLQMISADARNSDLIKPLTRVPKVNRWIPEAAYLICISSSRHKRWPWSNTENESVAERIFEKTYPIISSHLTNYKDILKSRTGGSRGKFYWELSTREPKREIYPEFYQPKIIYPLNSSCMRALYDSSEAFILGSSYCIPTKDLSLLAILNSTLFNWYAQFICKAPRGGNSLLFSKENMVNISIAPRTTKQKVNLSHLVQQILNTPDSPNVRNLEEDINKLVYDLYELTVAEIALIEEESNQ